MAKDFGQMCEEMIVVESELYSRAAENSLQCIVLCLMCSGRTRCRGVLKDFFLLRTALRDRPKGPSTTNHQPPPTANHQPPPATSRDQPPAANHCQPPSTTNPQLPPTATNRQPPTAHRQHMVCPRAFLCNGTLSFPLVKDR